MRVSFLAILVLIFSGTIQSQSAPTRTCDQKQAKEEDGCTDCNPMEGYGGSGYSMQESCTDDCRANTANCENCCWECEAIITGPGNCTQLAVFQGQSNDDIDTTAPFQVDIEVTSNCVDDGETTTSKCVAFQNFNSHPVAISEIVCWELKCGYCRLVEVEE